MDQETLFSITTFVGGGVITFITFYFTVLTKSTEVKKKALEFEKAQVEWRRKKEKWEQEKEELSLQLQDLSTPIVMRLNVISDLQELVYKVFKETNADRFILFIANNGKTNFKRTTAVFEQHRMEESGRISIGATKRYIDFKFDADYLDMLKRIETIGEEIIYTDAMKESDLKAIYKYEKVVASKVFFILREHVTGDHDRIWYASIATHQEGGFVEKDEVVLTSYRYQIQRLLENCLSNHIDNVDK
jgi:hypothetical protein